MFIYALECTNNKFYIGKTTQNPNIQFLENNFNIGKNESLSENEWIKYYKPIILVEFYETDNNLEEDILTKKYMKMYGIDNVRGGSYSKPILEDWQIKLLEDELQCYQNSSLERKDPICSVKDCKNYLTSFIKNFDKTTYLQKFITIPEIINEINELNQIRIQINTEKPTIIYYKYINIKINKPTKYNLVPVDCRIELCPQRIKKHKKEIIKYESEVKLYNHNISDIDIKYNSPTIEICHFVRYVQRHNLIEISNNYIEDLYRIFIHRINIESKLNNKISEYFSKFFNKTLLITETDYDNLENFLNKIIESLYEKYANLL